MIGSIIGDIAGSRFEAHNHRSKEFDLFGDGCCLTDDSIMTLAVASAIFVSRRDYMNLRDNIVPCMQYLGQKYKDAGYGATFINWLWTKNPKPYGSYGNGAAMRVSPCGFAATSIDQAKWLSNRVTRVSHDHPEGLKGAEAVAVSVYLARTGSSKDDIRKYVQENYYDIDFTIDEIRPTYRFDVSCQGSVPVALEAFLESENFEDAIRTAVSVGGDSDTIGAITGSIAEAFYGIPESMIEKTTEYLDSLEMAILFDFEHVFPSKALDEDGKQTRTVYDVIDDMVDRYIPEGTPFVQEDDLPGGASQVWVDQEDMLPDFRPVDKGKHFRHIPDEKSEQYNTIDDIGKAIYKAGDKAAKVIRKAGKKAARKLVKAGNEAGKTLVEIADIAGDVLDYIDRDADK